MDQLPEEFQEAVKAMLTSSNESQAYYAWVEEQREGADIQVNDMPEGLPYYVDMANYQKSEDDTSGLITGTDENGNPVTVDTVEGTTEGDAAAEGDVASSEEGSAEGAEAADQAAEGDAAEGDEAAQGDSGEGDAAAE